MKKMLLRAISFAGRAHDGQIRKDGATPYMTHTFRACMILRDMFGVDDERALAAAVLHDTIEDTTRDYDAVKELFGAGVAGYVALLSKDKRKAERERDEDYYVQLKRAPNEVKLIKLADVYDNLVDLETIGCAEQINRTIGKSRKYLEVLKDEGDEKLSRAIRIVEALAAKKGGGRDG